MILSGLCQHLDYCIYRIQCMATSTKHCTENLPDGRYPDILIKLFSSSHLTRTWHRRTQNINPHISYSVRPRTMDYKHTSLYPNDQSSSLPCRHHHPHTQSNFYVQEAKSTSLFAIINIKNKTELRSHRFSRKNKAFISSF